MNYNIDKNSLEAVKQYFVSKLMTEGKTQEAQELTNLVAIAETRSLTEYEYKRFMDLQGGSKETSYRGVLAVTAIALIVAYLYWENTK